MPPKLALYSDLLGEESKSEEINKEQQASSEKQAINAATLRFQPLRRPGIQAVNKKSAPKIAFAKLPSTSDAGPPGAGSPENVSAAPAAVAPPAAKMTLADWANDEDDYYFEGQKRQRGGRKKKKKNKEAKPIAQDWDDIYDPSKPNHYEEYIRSEERIREIRDWKQLLYRHRLGSRRNSDLSSENDDEDMKKPSFAPPSSYNFAPPPASETQAKPVDIDMDETGDEVFARRMRMSQNKQAPAPILSSPPPPPPSMQQIPPPPLSTPPPPPPSIPIKAQAGVISRAPVRYNLPEAPPEIPATEDELEQALADDTPSTTANDDKTATIDGPAPRTNRPGQKGFAERLMAKYGWTKGSGLGASGSGITSALKVKVDKSQAGHGKIVGGKRKGGGAEVEGKHGVMSEVVILKGMVDGLDLSYELGPDGTLVQEIGEECGEKYGAVQRVFIPRDWIDGSVPCFIHFTNQLSALRAVNALEGRIFNGNTIEARFFDEDNFKKGIYQ